MAMQTPGLDCTATGERSRHRFTLAFAAALALSLTGIGIAIAQNGTGVLKRSDGIHLRCNRCGTAEDIRHHITRGRGNTTT